MRTTAADQHPRAAGGTPAGGQFTTKARTEAAVELPSTTTRCCRCATPARIRMHLSTGPADYCPLHAARLLGYDADLVELLDGPGQRGGPPLAGFRGGRVEETSDEDYRSRTTTTHGSGNAAFDTAVRTLLGVQDPRAIVSVTSTVEEHGSTYTPEGWSDITIACAGKEQRFDTLPDLLRRLDFAGEPKEILVPALLGRDVLVDLPHEQVACRLGNASDRQVLLVFPGGTKRPRDIDQWWHNADAGEEWGWVDLSRVWKLRPTA